MANVYPQLNDDQLAALQSPAEATVYRAFQTGLADTFDVYFSTTWILRKQGDEARDGEIDFVICHPNYGFLTIEVKGGGIGFDARTGQWYSIDRNDNRHDIKDPIRQSLGAKYSILAKLQEHSKWQSLGIKRLLCGHAVMFPNLGESSRLQRPDLPEIVLGIGPDLEEPHQWIDQVFSYWRGTQQSLQGLGQRGIELFRSVFSRSFEARPLLSQTLAAEEDRRIKLTQEQSRTLDLLQSRRRVAISGGAGTGKTVLAVEKARRLASEGFSTLLVCFNRPLANHLSLVCEATEKLEVKSFHQLCTTQIEEARNVSKRDLLTEMKEIHKGGNLWNLIYPLALAESVELTNKQYDAIVCDEGQDFDEQYWLPLEMLLTDEKLSPLYIFFDDNQNLYHRSNTLPIKDQPFPLTINCRNTEVIHKASYRYYQGVPVKPPTIMGKEIDSILAVNRSAQAIKLHGGLVELMNKEGIGSGEVVVLVADARYKTEYYEAIRHLPLPRPATWLEEGVRSPNTVLLDTVNRFKGLESTIVFLWGLDELDLSSAKETLYVGMSRAKSMLYLVGSQNVCKNVLSNSY